MTPNVSAFLTTISHGEGSDRPPAPPDPYRTCFAFRHVTADLNYHPHELRPDGTREWAGESLDFLGPPYVGEISSAAGRYQITLPTFKRLRDILKTVGFGPAVQDDMAIQLIKEKGALDLIFAGRVGDAITACNGIWASLPGSESGQPQKRLADLINTYGTAGGSFA